MTQPIPTVAHAGAPSEFPLVVGQPVELSPLIRRILAPNPSVMTGPGTNTYLVGHDAVSVIDPGPDDPRHVEAILSACSGKLAQILCTHTHIDHWPAAATLAAQCGAPIMAFGSRDGLEVNRILADGDVVHTAEYTLQAVHTPGHAANHVCYLLEEEGMLFTGDHVMQGTTVVIAPPDGDMSAYFASLRRLIEWQPPINAFAPAHGHIITDPNAILEAYLAHRSTREQVVWDALSDHDGSTVDTLVEVAYSDVDPALYPVARLSLWAHLRKLADDGRVSVDDPNDIDAARWFTIAARRK